MTPDEIRSRVDDIAAELGDNENAHADEDALHQDVLRYIAGNAPDPWRAVAAMALETTHLDYARWYA